MTAISEGGEQLRPGLSQTVNERYPGSMISKDDVVPLAPLRRPLEESRLTFASTAGVKPRTLPFDVVHPDGDYTFRRVPSDAHPRDLEIHQLEYPTDGAHRDLNVIFPIQRLQELATEGVLGGLKPTSSPSSATTWTRACWSGPWPRTWPTRWPMSTPTSRCWRPLDPSATSRSDWSSGRSSAGHPDGVGVGGARRHRARQAAAGGLCAVPDGAPLRCAVPHRRTAAGDRLRTGTAVHRDLQR